MKKLYTLLFVLIFVTSGIQSVYSQNTWLQTSVPYGGELYGFGYINGLLYTGTVWYPNTFGQGTFVQNISMIIVSDTCNYVREKTKI